MHNPMTVAQELVEHTLSEHAGQVDLVCIYGSRARGDARPDSDLDIYYVPAEGCSPPVGHTFLLDGLLYDFWGIDWGLLEGFATGKVRGFAFAPALVAGSQVLYATNEAAAERLAGLQQEIVRLESPDARREMVDRAITHYGQVEIHLATLRRAAEIGALSDVRYAGWHLVEAVWECLALANQVYSAKGLAKSLGEVDRFAQRPAGLAERIAVIMLDEDCAKVLAAAVALARDTRAVLRVAQETLSATHTVTEIFAQAYPELKDALGKVRAACASGDRLVASAEALKVQLELTQMLSETAPGVFSSALNTLGEMSSTYRAAGFPDLIAAAGRGTQELVEAVVLFDARLRVFLLEHGVTLEEVGSIEALW